MPYTSDLKDQYPDSSAMRQRASPWQSLIGRCDLKICASAQRLWPRILLLDRAMGPLVEPEETCHELREIVRFQDVDFLTGAMYLPSSSPLFGGFVQTCGEMSSHSLRRNEPAIRGPIMRTAASQTSRLIADSVCRCLGEHSSPSHAANGCPQMRGYRWGAPDCRSPLWSCHQGLGPCMAAFAWARDLPPCRPRGTVWIPREDAGVSCNGLRLRRFHARSENPAPLLDRA